MKKNKYIFLFLALVLTSGCLSDAKSQEKESFTIIGNKGTTEIKTTIHFFWGQGCPYCEKEKLFLEEMKRKYPELEIKSYEAWSNPANAKFLQDLGKAYGIKIQGVPVTFIGDFKPIVGFSENMKQDIENKIKNCIEKKCIDPKSKI